MYKTSELLDFTISVYKCILNHGTPMHKKCHFQPPVKAGEVIFASDRLQNRNSRKSLIHETHVVC
jgi:hypothetical protein